MDLERHLENLRAKPEHVRRRISFWSAFGITAIIFVFWLGSFNSNSTPKSQVLADKVNKAGTPAQSLVAGVGDLFVDIKEIIFGAKKVTYSSIEVLPK